MPKTLLNSLKQQYHGTNIEDKVDQVVAMIFRITPQLQIQLLFLQRAYSENDYYSGDICFPGGYRQQGQKCLTTAMRETFEETQLRLSESEYIGALQFTFTTRMGVSRVRGKGGQKIQLYMGILMFQTDYQKSKQIKLNQQEIRSYRWINIKHFLQGDRQNLTTWSQSYSLQPNKKTVILFPALYIGMDRQLYGLTLYTIILFIVSIDRIIIENKKLPIETIQREFFDRFCYHCTDIKVEGDNQEQLKIARKMYMENRVGFLRSKL